MQQRSGHWAYQAPELSVSGLRMSQLLPYSHACTSQNLKSISEQNWANVGTNVMQDALSMWHAYAPQHTTCLANVWTEFAHGDATRCWMHACMPGPTT